MLGNRPEFHIVDLAAAMLGATPFSIYLTYPPEDIRYLIEDAGAKVAIVEQAYLEPLLAARQDLPDLAHVIVVDGEPPQGTISLGDVEGSNPGFDVNAASAEVSPSDLVTLIYTSGTTGPPKGVQLSHHNIMSAAQTVEQVIRFEPGGRVISWLPAAHIAERMAHHYIPIDLRRHSHLLPQPARGPLLSAAGQADVVLRGSPHLGEAQGRARGDAGGPARGAATPDPGGTPSRHRARSPQAARRARPARARGRRWPKPTRRCSRSCARCWGSTS